MFLKFIRTFHPDFPYPPQEEKLNDIIEKISKYDLVRVYDSKEFKNNISNIGVNYLKSNFKSYWNSKFKGSLSPIKAWQNDEVMRKVIEYRIGINNSDEVFDFSLHQLIRGLSAKRYTISFFKPLLAAAIYKVFIGNKRNPIVIDPCAGFGSRLIGFKSIYPAGRYIGIEPNIDTFDELQDLAKNFNDVELYNCKLEDFNYSKECDLTFTSIPYFDLEEYSNNIHYDSFDDWTGTFIKSLTSFKNLLINVPDSLKSLFGNKITDEFYIINNTSHFNKKNSKKSESLLKLY